MLKVKRITKNHFWQVVRLTMDVDTCTIFEWELNIVNSAPLISKSLFWGLSVCTFVY